MRLAVKYTRIASTAAQHNVQHAHRDGQRIQMETVLLVPMDMLSNILHLARRLAFLTAGYVPAATPIHGVRRVQEVTAANVRTIRFCHTMRNTASITAQLQLVLRIVVHMTQHRAYHARVHMFSIASTVHHMAHRPIADHAMMSSQTAKLAVRHR